MSVHEIGDLREQGLSMLVHMCNVGLGDLSQHRSSKSPYMFFGGKDHLCQHKLCESEYEYNDDIGDLSENRLSMYVSTHVQCWHRLFKSA